ncbi:N-acetyl-alpha-D-glucosaminyl-diphospho-ditrans, octacis-undecaprenol 4-epimerase [Sideroxyarcus emersonii]|uniref:N-acetyl-alpha-D-glucosaminyl-diphospho-ditrans, octacis-undecaprenol 4-epimerase n=2 Tax=Sideroxyarcus emersonii TaxID=2764705 RepID=A0AAN1XC73_9PROT|nr:N-acetyl-alpha-D-glucosaminyl-diphospho-ditrans, octacis-undecaprenol 4-epimerase [Sideroxyarcus emersonii]
MRGGVDTSLRGCEIVRIPDISADTDWANALSGVATVIHLAARVHVMHEKAPNALAEFRKVNVAGTERLARSAAANGVRRLVYVSSIKVNGESTHGDHRFAESDVPLPQDPYGISKYEAELALHRIADETGLEVVILRPPLIYGAGVKGNFAHMLKILAKRIPLPLASVRNQRSLVYVGNMVDALIACAAHPAAAGQTYLVSDGEDVSTPDLLRRLGVAMECSAKLFPCPSSWLRLAGLITGKSEQIGRLQESLRIDSVKIRRQLNWNPPYSLQQGLQATAEWYRNTHS